VKINDSKNNAVNLGLDKTAVDKAAADKAEAANKQANVSTGSKSEDSVTLSPMAQQIQSLQANLGSENVFDADKVNEIKAAIMSGQFKVNTEKVADGLIQSVKDMLGEKP
jgi:negative regulator of flagellin synthesis FlgM